MSICKYCVFHHEKSKEFNEICLFYTLNSNPKYKKEYFKDRINGIKIICKHFKIKNIMRHIFSEFIGLLLLMFIFSCLIAMVIIGISFFN